MPGYIIERQLIDGDIVLFNRQPSLHRMSIMAHKVKVLQRQDLQDTTTADPPYNADFDGDEMNLHVPQTLEAQAEARYLMQVQEQIFSPKDGRAIIANGEDGIMGMYLLTQDDTYLTKDEAQYLLSLAGVRRMPKEAKNGMYRGKDIFSMLLPEGLNFELQLQEGEVHDKERGAQEGVVTKAVYGGGQQALREDSAGLRFRGAEEFLSKSSRMADAYSRSSG